MVEAAIGGDAEAFAGLFRIHHDTAMRVASSFVRGEADAEDVVQESFVKAWRAMDRFEVGAPFSPWMRAIVVNEARTHIRAGARRAEAVGRLERQAGRTTVPEASAEELLLAGEGRDEIDRAVRELSPRDQRVIRLRYGLGLSESEMSERLRVPPGTVKSRLSRALARLRDHLVIVILVLIALTAVAVPPVRAALERILGLTGAEKVIRVPELPDGLSPRPFDWGPAVDPAEIGPDDPFPSGPPSFRGIEPEARLRTDLGRPMLTLVYGEDTATIVGGVGPRVLAKLVPPDVDVRWVRVRGGEGLWIAGGAAHALATVDERGEYRPGPKTRIESGVLALEGPDGRDYRIQTEGGLRRALDLVRTLYTETEPRSGSG